MRPGVRRVVRDGGAPGDRGSMSVVAAAVVGLVVTVGTSAVVASALLVERHRLGGVADSSALAAADAAAGLSALDDGSACASAERVATANHASLGTCVVDGDTATVSVSRRVGLALVSARATAGQPADSSSDGTARSKK